MSGDETLMPLFALPFVQQLGTEGATAIHSHPWPGIMVGHGPACIRLPVQRRKIPKPVRPSAFSVPTQCRCRLEGPSQTDSSSMSLEML